MPKETTIRIKKNTKSELNALGKKGNSYDKIISHLIKFTYAKSGVDIDRKSESIAALVKNLKYKRKGFGGYLNIPGHFTGLVDFGNYALSLCNDGVGTKLLVASAMQHWSTVGIDCIAMNVNDTICVGAEPIAFVDYIAMDKLDNRITSEIGIGLERGATQANISIVGGEIAILPELVNGFDLAGTCLGFVEKNKIITGNDIKVGDKIIGLRSSGIHSNGLTLARKVFEGNGYFYTDKLPNSNTKIGKVLLEPTIIYVKEVLELVRKVRVKGLANITGGGLRNLLRLNEGVQYRITDPLEPQKIFKIIQELGNVDSQEMYQTFNMGMGFCVIVDKKDIRDTLSVFKRIEAKVVGEVVSGKGVSLPKLGLTYYKY